MQRPPRTSFSYSRRELLTRSAHGFGALAASALFGAPAAAANDPLRPKPRHFRARARNVIFLYMDGGPSQVDTFDPKPRLASENGKTIQLDVPRTQFDNVTAVRKSPWTFQRHGECGHEISELFPYLGTVADELLMVRSMTSEFPEHTSANYFLHTGHGIQGRPSMGAWMGFGLGSDARDLPGFVVLNGGLVPPGGLDNFGSGFLPASYQGSIFKPGDVPLANVRPAETRPGQQRTKLNLLERLDAAAPEALQADDQVESAIRNYELAWRMQSAVPDLVDLSGESRAMRELYGLDSPDVHTATYARQCLLARRLVERGVRFIELTCPNVGQDRWDQHNDLKGGHEKNAHAVDQPIAGLLKDLRRRGLLDDTLVVFAGEFGRTPMGQGANGRDHNPHGFTIWLAGGGVRGGEVYGATDEYGYFAVQDKVSIHDLHATMLHLMGMDHERLTMLFSGREMRLTDVHGEVIHDWIA